MRSAWLVTMAVVGLWACSDSNPAFSPPKQDAGTDSATEDSGNEDSGDARCGDAGCCKTVLDCRDDLYCNGQEACDPTDDNADDRGCVAGTPVVCIEDDIACSTVVCNEADNRCAPHGPDHDGDGSFDVTCVDHGNEPLGDDCDDDDSNRFRGNTETCDLANHDEDCDPATFGNRDEDNDTFASAECCNLNSNGDLSCGTDCDDLDDRLRPNAIDLCDQLDNDCDVLVDEGGITVQLYTDLDGDGHGDTNSSPTGGCDLQSGYAISHDDCDDARPDVNPGVLEICDAVDNDCDTLIDETCGG